MLTKEESKFQLSKLFGEVGDDVTSRILNELSRNSRHYHKARVNGVENGINYWEYGPFPVKDYDYFMTVRIYYGDAGRETYREVRFSDEINDSGVESNSAIEVGYTIPPYDVCTVSLNQAILSLEGNSMSYFLDENYMMVCKKTALASAARYDFNDNKFYASGDFTIEQLNHVLINVPLHKFDADLLDSQFNSMFPNHPLLGNTKNKSKLSLLFSENLKDALRLLGLCSDYPNLWHLLGDKRILKGFIALANKSYKKWDPDAFVAGLNLKGKNPSEIFDLSEVMVDYFGEFLDNGKYFHYNQKNLIALRGLSKIADIKSMEDMKYLKKLLYDIGDLESNIGNICYLLNLGLSLKEICFNLQKIYDTQNRSFDLSLDEWCQLIRVREIFKGQRVRYVPKNCVSEISVYERARMNMPISVRELYLDNMKKLRRNLVIKTKQFEISSVMDMCYSQDDYLNNELKIKSVYAFNNYPEAYIVASMTDKGLITQEIPKDRKSNPVINHGKIPITNQVPLNYIHDGYERIINNCLRGNDFLFYRKGNNDKLTLLKIKGDSIIVFASELGPNHVKHLEKFALENKMILVVKS